MAFFGAIIFRLKRTQNQKLINDAKMQNKKNVPPTHWQMRTKNPNKKGQKLDTPNELVAISWVENETIWLNSTV